MPPQRPQRRLGTRPPLRHGRRSCCAPRHRHRPGRLLWLAARQASSERVKQGRYAELFAVGCRGRRARSAHYQDNKRTTHTNFSWSVNFFMLYVIFTVPSRASRASGWLCCNMRKQDGPSGRRAQPRWAPRTSGAQKPARRVRGWMAVLAKPRDGCASAAGLLSRGLFLCTAGLPWLRDHGRR